MFGIIYIRSLVAIAGITGMMCYLQTTDALIEAFAAIVAVVYIDKNLSDTTTE